MLKMAFNTIQSNNHSESNKTDLVFETCGKKFLPKVLNSGLLNSACCHNSTITSQACVYNKLASLTLSQTSPGFYVSAVQVS